MKAVGIDLAGSENRNTGFCILGKNLETKTLVLHSDEEIIREIEKVQPEIISIDAPLALPKGRDCLKNTCKCSRFGHFRKCDLELRKMGIRLFPPTLGPMRKLTMRGIRLKKHFEKEGYKVIESFPGSIQDVLKIPRKNAGLEKLRRGLIKYGFVGDVKKKEITDDELDAVCSALVGKLFLENNYTAIGDPEEVLMILPKF